MKIAILEADIVHADFVRLALQESGHNCESFPESFALMRRLRSERFDLLILRWNQSDLSGYDVLKWVRRSADRYLPILIMTDRFQEEDVVSGLAAGADICMTTPIRRTELVARVDALFRRAGLHHVADPVLTLGNYVVMPQARRILHNGKDVQLTHKEMDVALLLFTSEGQVISRDHMVEAIWGRSISTISRTLDTHLSRVRTKLGLGPENGVQLLPVYALGYKLESVAQEHHDHASVRQVG